jgi:hypothetical protein
MKNRAKCKLCNDIIESYHSEDHVVCKCGEIECFGGDALRCAAKDFKNFVRVDDEGNEIIITYKEKGDISSAKPVCSGVSLIENLIDSYDRLPDSAMHQPVSNADLISVLTSLLEAFKAL